MKFLAKLTEALDAPELPDEDEWTNDVPLTWGAASNEIDVHINWLKRNRTKRLDDDRGIMMTKNFLKEIRDSIDAKAWSWSKFPDELPRVFRRHPDLIPSHYTNHFYGIPPSGGMIQFLKDKIEKALAG